MTSDPMATPPRCSAKSKQTGKQCRQRPIPGGTVCRFHGGKAPQTQAAAEARQAEAAADQAVRKLWVGLDQAVAVKDPVDLLARMAGALEQMTDVVGSRVNDLQGKVGAGEHLTQLRAEVVLLEKLLGHLRAVGTDMARLGIAERQVELEQARAELVVSALHAAVGAVPELLPDQRTRLVSAFLAGLGRGPELVAGEVVSS